MSAWTMPRGRLPWSRPFFCADLREVLSRRPAEGASAQQVDVQMIDCLPAVFPVIHHDAVALVQAARASNLRRGPEKVPKERIVCLLRARQRVEVPARSNEDVRRRLRVDVRESVAVFILVDGCGWNCTFDDLAEQAAHDGNSVPERGASGPADLHWAGMRLFVGIPLTPSVTRALQERTAYLRVGQEDLRWTAPESWHITLQFLGEATDDRCACVLAELRKIDAQPVRIALGGLLCFERVGVVAAGVELTASLSALQRSVVLATSRCGFVPESRPYAPHITLARARRGSRLRAHGELQQALRAPHRLPAFEAREFLLYESLLGGAGARYQVRGHFALGASAEAPLP